MKSKTDSMEWIPLWVDKWIFGTTRIELQPDERSVWIDLMAVAAKDHGFIRANVGVAYPPQQLSGLLCITEELLLRAIQKCINVGKLCQCENGGGYFLPNWAEYQLSERHKRRFREKIEQIQALSSKTDIVAENENKNGPIGEDINNIKKRRGEDINNAFFSFWKLYPIKKEKSKAIKEWKKLKPDLQIVLLALKGQIEYKNMCDSENKFCPDFPYAERWIKNKRWEDEIDGTSEDPLERIRRAKEIDRQRIRDRETSGSPDKTGDSH